MAKRKPKPKNVLPSPPPEGGLGGGLTVDPSKPSDRRLIRLALREEWPITPAIKAKLVKLTVDAMERAAVLGEARDVAGCARVLVDADKTNQKDVHELEKYDRIDAGKATDAVLLIDDLGEEKA